MDTNEHGFFKVRRTGIFVDSQFQNRQSSVRSDIIRKFKTEYAAPTELEPMRMINYKDAAPAALKNPPGQRGAGRGARGWAMTEIRCRRMGTLFRFSFWVGRLGHLAVVRRGTTQ
jgi:hypothetical protein